MNHKIKLKDEKTELLLQYNEKQEVKGQQTSFSFSCSIQNLSFTASLENIWFEEDDLKYICNGITTYINGSSNVFNSFPSYSDLLIQIRKADSMGHHIVDFILEDSGRQFRHEGRLEVDSIDIEKLKHFFNSFL